MSVFPRPCISPLLDFCVSAIENNYPHIQKCEESFSINSKGHEEYDVSVRVSREDKHNREN